MHFWTAAERCCECCERTQTFACPERACKTFLVWFHVYHGSHHAHEPNQVLRYPLRKPLHKRRSSKYKSKSSSPQDPVLQKAVKIMKHIQTLERRIHGASIKSGLGIHPSGNQLFKFDGLPGDGLTRS